MLKGSMPVPLKTENPAELPPVPDEPSPFPPELPVRYEGRLVLRDPSPFPPELPVGYRGRPVLKVDGVAAVPIKYSYSL